MCVVTPANKRSSSDSLRVILPGTVFRVASTNPPYIEGSIRVKETILSLKNRGRYIAVRFDTGVQATHSPLLFIARTRARVFDTGY